MPGFELIDEKEKNAVCNIFDEGGVLFAHGFDNYRKKYYVREFEQDCANYFSSKYTLAVASGTAAVKTALVACGVEPGDEVITQAFNFIATIEAIVDIGAKPIIVDVDDSLNMDPEEVNKVLSDKTKVILPVHMLGVPANLVELRKIADAADVFLIEDNCESVGGKYQDQWLGTYGDVGIFSFDYGKNITCGEGGLILTNNKKIAERACQYHDHGHMNLPDVPRGMDKAGMPGFNYRMTEMQAAVGQVQLTKLDFILNENKKRHESLESIGNRFELREIFPDSSPSYDTFIFKVEDTELREKIVKHLNKTGIGTKNLPDAMQWHCAYYWGHILPNEQVQRAKETNEKLANYIAIPIWLKKTVNEYKELAIAISVIE